MELLNVEFILNARSKNGQKHQNSNMLAKAQRWKQIVIKNKIN